MCLVSYSILNVSTCWNIIPRPISHKTRGQHVIIFTRFSKICFCHTILRRYLCTDIRYLLFRDCYLQCCSPDTDPARSKIIFRNGTKGYFGQLIYLKTAACRIQTWSGFKRSQIRMIKMSALQHVVFSSLKRARTILSAILRQDKDNGGIRTYH